jgi:CheY-like chemotaxis protein
LLQPITLEGIVRWSRGGTQPGIGVEFMPSRDYGKLDAIVSLIQDRDPRTVARVVRMLVAEDNAHIAELICSGLDAAARRVFGDALLFDFATVENGASAIEMLQTSTFDALIIDLYLPVIDGVRVIDHARETLGLTQLPIIAISTGDARSSALAAGANMYLSKPMRLREVLDSVRQLVLHA